MVDNRDALPPDWEQIRDQPTRVDDGCGDSDPSSTDPVVEAELETLEALLRAPISEQEAKYLAESGCQRVVELIAAIGLDPSRTQGVEPSPGQAAPPRSADVGAVPDQAGGKVAGKRPKSARRKLPSLGEYELLEKLGQGGMGAVYKARHTRLDKIVAVKVLPRGRMSDPQAVARFEREMKAVGRVDHPNIVRAMDAREIGGTHFLVMEYAAGLDLGDVVRRTGGLRIADACEVVRQVAVGLQCAHENGLIHRDIKPSNVILTRAGQVKILDLGLARLNAGAEDQGSGGDMTSFGTAMGTPDYIAPEQAKDSHSADIRADIYSLGCTLYALLAGRPPFSGPKYQSHMEKIMGHLRDAPSPLGPVRADVPPGLPPVLQRMMAKNREDRYATPQEVAEALRPFVAGADLSRLAAEAAAGKHPAKQEVSADVGTAPGASSAVSDTSRRGSGGAAASAAAQLAGGDNLAPTLRVAASVRRKAPRPRVQRAGLPPRARLLIGLGLLGVLLLAGVLVITIRNREGKTIAQLTVPDDSQVEITQRPDTPQAKPADSAGAGPAKGHGISPKEAKPKPRPPAAASGAEAEPVDRAISLGLDWVARQQTSGGHWASLKSGPLSTPEESTMTATAMALVPLLRSGSTHMTGKYQSAVARGLDVLISRQQPDGDLRDGHSMYTHGLASIAICEAYARSRDPALCTAAQKCVDFIVRAQHPADGGWRYKPGDEGDTSVLAWQFAALTIARESGLVVPEETFPRVTAYLDRAALQQGTEYAYQPIGKKGSLSTSAIGLWCRMQLGWDDTRSALREGVKKIGESGPDANDIYFTYHATLLMHGVGGESWTRWRAALERTLPACQDSQGSQAGSWPDEQDRWCKTYGRLCQTSLSLMALSVGRPSPHANPYASATPPPAIDPFDAARARQHQEAWARYLDLPVEFTNSIGMQFQLIPPGEFEMGCTTKQIEQVLKEAKEQGFFQGFLDSVRGEGPQHHVRITEPFYLGKCEVSVGQFREFIEATGYKTEAEQNGQGGAGLNIKTGQWEVSPGFTWRTPGFPQQDQHPVVVVSWNDATNFCKWLSTLESRTCRLPTEAEWEYACRAGTTTRYFAGDETSGLQLIANVADGSLRSVVPSFTLCQGSGGWNDRYPFTAPVGQFESNGFGLHDVHGNAWEWCSDAFDAGYYAKSPTANPPGPSAGSNRMIRGGSWTYGPLSCRSSVRRGCSPTDRDPTLGFRVAVALPCAPFEANPASPSSTAPERLPSGAARGGVVVPDLRLLDVRCTNIAPQCFDAELEVHCRLAAEYRLAEASGKPLTDWTSCPADARCRLSAAKIPRNAEDDYEVYVERKIGSAIRRFQIPFKLNAGAVTSPGNKTSAILPSEPELYGVHPPIPRQGSDTGEPDSTWYYNRACAQLAAGRLDEALSDLTQSILQNATYSLAYNNRGATYSRSGQYDKALADFAKAIELEPGNRLAYRNRALVYRRLGDSAKADADAAVADRLEREKAKNVPAGK